MKKNSKYIVIGGTLLCISLALVIVASTATSGNNCNTCPRSVNIGSSNRAFMNAAAATAD